MNTVNEKRLAEFLDREAIRDCLFRYCRGIDRCDAELLRTAYWEDAFDNHGVAYAGPVREMIDIFMNTLKKMDQTQHMLGNIFIELDGSTARVETYFHAYHRIRDETGTPKDVVLGGRYLDRMEKRGDEWRIMWRRVVSDWYREYPDSADWENGSFVGHPSATTNRKPDDPVYGLFENPK